MKQPIRLRGEPPPDDTVKVVRAGALDPDRLRRTAERCFADYGYYGMSVFAALDTDVEGLFAAGVGNMQRYGQYWTSTAGALRRAGFPLLDSEDRPHFDVVLADLGDHAVASLLGCFTGPKLKERQP